jgi:hypothetical protein
MATLALSQLGVGPLGRAMIGTSVPVGESLSPRWRPRMPADGPQFDVGDEFRVDDRTTGWTSWYRILTYLGFDEYRVRIDTGTYVERRCRRPKFRRVRRITTRLGGATLAVLQEAGRL